MSNGMIVENPDHVTTAEIIVGIPSYNEADSIALPADVASRGLVEYFPSVSSVLINVDNHSEDGTREAFLGTPTRVPKVYISTPPGVRGKGNNLRNLFKAAVELGARAVVVIDADLKSITPAWIRYLAEPLLGRYDYVTPIYLRHKYDGTITNHIAYPLLRTLFELRVRQPIGGDFGFSGRLARAFLAEKVWNERISNFGIDIWMTTIAIARRFNVCQAFLGSPKIHRPKDPSADLEKMFTQVVSTIFDLMIDFEYLWKDTGSSRPSSIYGFGLGVDEQPPAVDVNTARLLESFKKGFDTWGDTWREVIPLPELTELERATSGARLESFYFPSRLWARMLFDFAVAYKKQGSEETRAELMKALIPLYHSRVLSFVNKTRQQSLKDTEEYLEDISRVFEAEKFYLIERWDREKASNGRLFQP